MNIELRTRIADYELQYFICIITFCRPTFTGNYMGLNKTNVSIITEERNANTLEVIHQRRQKGGGGSTNVDYLTTMDES